MHTVENANYCRAGQRCGFEGIFKIFDIECFHHME